MYPGLTVLSMTRTKISTFVCNSVVLLKFDAFNLVSFGLSDNLQFFISFFINFLISIIILLYANGLFRFIYIYKIINFFWCYDIRELWKKWHLLLFSISFYFYLQSKKMYQFHNGFLMMKKKSDAQNHVSKSIYYKLIQSKIFDTNIILKAYCFLF